MNLGWPRAARSARARSLFLAEGVSASALKKLLTRINTSRRGSHESPRFDHTTNVATWYVAVTFGVNGTLSRKITSVERSGTEEKVDSSKFNQRFFWLVQPLTTLTRKHHTAPCFTTHDFIPCAYCSTNS